MAGLEELAAARRIVCYGVGREGLMMRALAMRLYHAGLDAHVVGDMSCPPVGAGDLLVVSAGPGGFSTVDGLIGVAKQALCARVACVTARPEGTAAMASDRILPIPAQTMASDKGDAAILNPADGVAVRGGPVSRLRTAGPCPARPRVAPEAMRARHTNLE